MTATSQTHTEILVKEAGERSTGGVPGSILGDCQILPPRASDVVNLIAWFLTNVSSNKPIFSNTPVGKAANTDQSGLHSRDRASAPSGGKGAIWR